MHSRGYLTSLRRVVTCSPKTDPATMRVRKPETGGRSRTLDEEVTHPRADRPQTARGGPKARRRDLGPRGRQAARHRRSDLPPLEEPIRWHKGRRDEALEGAGEGERPPEENSCRSGGGHQRPQRGESGKLLSPARRRVAVDHVRRELKVSERRACRVIGQPRSS